MKHAREFIGAMGCLTWGLAVVACSSSVEPSKPSPTPAPTPLAPTASAQQPVPNLPVLPGETTPTPTPTPIPTGTGPTTPQTGCTPQPGDVCDQCLSAACCSQVLACENNADCVAIDTCTAQCQQLGNTPQADQCYQVCDSQHPVGWQILQTVFQCAQTSCAAQCQ
jgi:hypothetical protein